MIIGTVALALLVAWMLVLPHLSAPTETLTSVVPGGSLQSLIDQKERCVQVLKDLELDYAMGKLEEEDYTETRRRLSSELAALLTQVDGATVKRS